MAIENTNHNQRIDLREILKNREDETSRHGKLKFIPADSLKTDHRYQRHPNQTHVNRIARNFNPQIFGTIDVSERDDGDYYIVNGQHRVSAVKAMGKGETPVPCIVHTDLGYEAEALMFHLMNSQTRPMTPQEKLKGAIEAGDESALAIRSSVERSGFALNLESSARSGGEIPGVGALIKVNKEYKDGHLDVVLQTIAATWGTGTGPRHTLIDGVASFISFYRDVWDRKRFVSQLRRVDMEAVAIKGRHVADVMGISTAMGATYQLVEHYNHGLLAKNKLPSIEEIRVVNKMKGKTNG